MLLTGGISENWTECFVKCLQFNGWIRSCIQPVLTWVACQDQPCGGILPRSVISQSLRKLGKTATVSTWCVVVFLQWMNSYSYPWGGLAILHVAKFLSAVVGASPSVRPQGGVKQALHCRSWTHTQLSLVLCKDVNDHVRSILKWDKTKKK